MVMRPHLASQRQFEGLDKDAIDLGPRHVGGGVGRSLHDPMMGTDDFVKATNDVVR
jgi:hypothetical protein